MYEGLRTATTYNKTMPNVYKAIWIKTGMDNDSVGLMDKNKSNYFIDKEGSVHLLGCNRYMIDGTRLITEMAVNKTMSKYRIIRTYYFKKNSTFYQNNTSPWYTKEEVKQKLKEIGR